MAIIDQRILIPARQEVVWAYLSDLSKNAEWQSDCQGVSFLSTKHDGAGTRWRSTTDRGKDTVLEITSWYNGLGYEYVYVDGVPLSNTKGRLRLQEIPEGTVVQWTFSFEGGGMLGAGRNARQFDATMAASLKALYKQIKAFNQSDEMVARSLMREAPDVEARAAYKPRHPSSLTDTGAEVTEDAVLMPAPDEPKLDAQDAGMVAAIDLSAEPPVAVEDTKPRPALPDIPPGDERFAPKPEPAPEPEPEPVSEPDPESPSAEASPPGEPAPDRTAAAVAAAAAAAALPPSDAHGKSIWEVFGVDRPPEAPIVAATTASAPDETPAPEEAAPEPARTPDPKETLPLEAVPPAVTVATVATVIEAVPDVPAAPEPSAPEPEAVVTAPPAAPGGVRRQGLRAAQRRNLMRLRRPN